MSPLATLIQQQNLASDTADTILTAMNNSVVISSDSSLHNYTWVAQQYGVQAAEMLLTAIQAVGLTGAATTYCASGFSLSDSITQGQLTALAAANAANADLVTLCNNLKQIGINDGPQWKAWGLSSGPSLDDINAALAEISNYQTVLLFLNNVWNPAVAANQTPTQLKALVANW